MGDVIEVSWADILEEEGVLKRGFGSIPKYTMLDPNLSITAKAIYAYLCACAGNGVSTYPGRDTVVHYLGINKDTYHKYLKELRDSGYISVRKADLPPGQAHKFTHNIYTIESYPKRFSEDPRYQIPDAGDTISVKGIRAAGYGMIPRMVMEDQRISAKAKALYAYLAGYTGGGKTAFPELKKTLYHLHISRNTYFTLIKELEEVNYVEVVQRHVNGRLGVNDYFLVSNPSLSNVNSNTYYNQRKRAVSSSKPDKKSSGKAPSLPDTSAQAQEILQESPAGDVSVLAENILHKYSQADVSFLVAELLQKINPAALSRQSTNFSDAGTVGVGYTGLKSFAAEGLFQSTKFSDIGKQDIGIQDAGKQDIEKQDAKKQDSGNPDTTINNRIINNSSIINLIDQQQHQTQTPLCDWFDSMDRIDVEREVKDKMGFYAVEQGSAKFGVQLHQALITLVVDTILQKTPTIRIGKKQIDREEVVKRLYELTYWDYDYVIESVNRVKHEIRNQQAYYLATLYNAKGSLDLKISREVAQDLG